MNGKCPRPGCQRNRSFGHAFCKTCWFQLPKAIRDNIWRAFNSMCLARGDRNKSHFDKKREEHAAALQAAYDFFAQESEGAN